MNQVDKDFVINNMAETYKERKRNLIYSLANFRHTFILEEFKKTSSQITIKERKKMVKEAYAYAKDELKLHPEWLDMIRKYKVHSIGNSYVNWELIKLNK